MRSAIVEIENYTEWVERSAKAILDRVLMFENRSVNIALSGGKSPGPIYMQLAKLLIDHGLSSHVKIFVVDERNVSLDSEMSNSGLLLSIFPNNMVVPFNPCDMNSTNYWRLIQDNLVENNFDIVVLGCGEDGHIGSIFPNSGWNQMDSAKNFVTCDTPQGTRHTLTLRAIVESRYKIVTINNNPLKARFFKELRLDESYPINKVKSTANTLTVIHT